MKNLEKYQMILDRKRDPLRRKRKGKDAAFDALTPTGPARTHNQGKRQVESRNYMDTLKGVFGRRSKKDRRGGASSGVLG